MTSPESTSESSWGNAYIPTVLATDDTGTDLGSVPPRHQTSMLGIDIHTDITDNQLARPAQYNQEYLAATREELQGTWRAEIPREKNHPSRDRNAGARHHQSA